jgi:citrate lyase subunit beta / citryl-CoA lyase
MIPPEHSPEPETREARRERALARRSMLFVPANRPKFVEGAHTRKADAIILDLEDSVPLVEKPIARRALADAVPAVGSNGADVFVRVNKPFRLVVEDLDAAVAARPRGIVLPKVESAEEVKILDGLTGEREIQGGLALGTFEFKLVIESALGLENISAIAAASPRATTLSLGLEDLSKELEIDLTLPGYDFSWAHGRVIMAARAHGMAPLGLVRSVANFADLGSLAKVVADSRQFGYVGASCIHPNQVPILNAGFSPSQEELAKAREIIEAYERAEREGTSAVALDGRMVDIPVVERAREKIRRATRTRGVA